MEKRRWLKLRLLGRRNFCDYERDARQDAEQSRAGQGCPVWVCPESYKEMREYGPEQREAGGRASAGRMHSSQEREANFKQALNDYLMTWNPLMSTKLQLTEIDPRNQSV